MSARHGQPENPRYREEVQRWRSSDRRIRRQIQHWHVFVVTERIGPVRPVENVWPAPQRFNSMLGKFVILGPCHAEVHGRPPKSSLFPG